MDSIFKYCLCSLLVCLSLSCTSDITFNTETFESLLVVDATFTDELTQQEVFLSRTFPFGEEVILETGATVIIVSDGIEITLNETEAGIYKSTTPFKAEPNVIYQLKIETNDGKTYSSTTKTLTTQTTISDITIDRVTNDDGIDGMGLFVNSFDPTNSSQYYRYEYEETFKIIAPLWVKLDARTYNDEELGCTIIYEDRPENLRVCYRTEDSNTLNIISSAALFEDRVENHLVRFLSNQDHKISHRYSLLLKQYVLSEEGYNYLDKLNRFTSEGSVFSQVQSGFLFGNINNVSNSSEKVIGYFEVSTVAEQRVFFNYRDFYPTENLPPYIRECYNAAPLCDDINQLVDNGALIYEEEYTGEPTFMNPGPLLFVARACGDCTVLGTNIVPDFWTE